jgi:dolichol-phosphate mannosyltransferase
MYLSVVIPCMNEEASIPGLVSRLTQAIAPWKDRAQGLWLTC